MSEGYWRFIEPIFNKINIEGVELFLSTYRTVPLRLAMLYAAHFCRSEVCNGGFRQLFINSSGVLAPEAVAGFRAIGQPNVAGIVQTAMDALESPYPRDRTLRILRLSGLMPRKFDTLDRRFYALIGIEGGGFETAADRYAVL